MGCLSSFNTTFDPLNYPCAPKSVKSSSMLCIIHLHHCVFSVQAEFSPNRKEKVGWCNIRAIHWLWRAFESGNIQFLLGYLAVRTLALSKWIKVKGLHVFWNLAAFSERVDSALLQERMVNLICYLLGASNSVRSREFPRKWSICPFACNCHFDTDW
jgi:hypothetical protein